ncbi:MAG TPA: hypothetical protein VF163_08080 [Micromonosporaceae bacterium]
MGTTGRRTPPSPASRRAGYVVAVVLNAIVLFVLNVWPGWTAASFLTDQTDQVIGLVNVSIVVGLVANVVYLVRDPPWLRSLGDLITTGIALVVSLRIWQVFPFDFGQTGFDWAVLIRVLLVIAIVGSAIAILVHAVRLIRLLTAG